jgi:hypothetical protein
MVFNMYAWGSYIYFISEQFLYRHFSRHVRDDNLALVMLEVSTSISSAVAGEGINFLRKIS